MKRSFFFFILLAFISRFLLAVPADPSPRKIQQKDGRTLTYVMSGDEFYFTLRTSDGYTLTKNDKNEYVYATKNSEGDLIPTTIIACDAEFRTTEENAFLNTISKYLYSEKKYTSAKKEKLKHSKMTSNFPTKGEAKLLLLLADFPNRRFEYGDTASNYFHRMSNEQGFIGNGHYDADFNPTEALKSGSIRDYYYENSNEELKLQIDVKGPFLLPRSDTYYAGRVPEMIKAVCDLAHANGVDFSEYDNDGDGKVDAIHVIYAGWSQASSEEKGVIWPHRSQLTGKLPEFNGKTILDYSCSAERQGPDNYMAGIGVACHEFGHILGMPDWYDTNYDTDGKPKAYPLHQWSIMDAGNYLNHENTPPALTSVEKEMLNWHNHTILDTAGTYNLKIWPESSTSYKIETDSEDEYFIIENRQRKGWDSYIPASGMMLFYVDQQLVNRWFDGKNDINTDPDNMGYFIVCADERRGTSPPSNLTGDPFPGSANNTSFSDETSPAPKLRYSSGYLNKPITEIKELPDSTIQFRFKYNTISMETGDICSNNADEMAPLVAKEYENSSYLWLINNNNSWEPAPGENNKPSYKVSEIKDSLSFKRIVTIDGKPDTSLAYKLYLAPSGGVVTPTYQKVVVNKEKAHLTFDGYRNKVLHWESKKGDNEWQIIDSTKNTLEIEYLETDTYSYRAFVQSAKCPAVYSEEVAVEVVEGFDDYIVYPNPSSGEISLFIPNGEVHDIEIFNTLGKLVFSQKDVNINNIHLNLQHLGGGVYIVKFSNKKDNTIHDRKLIISRTK